MVFPISGLFVHHISSKNKNGIYTWIALLLAGYSQNGGGRIVSELGPPARQLTAGHDSRFLDQASLPLCHEQHVWSASPVNVRRQCQQAGQTGLVPPLQLHDQEGEHRGQEISDGT